VNEPLPSPLFKEIVDASPQGVMVTGDKGNLIYVNSVSRRLLSLSGTTEEDLLKYLKIELSRFSSPHSFSASSLVTYNNQLLLVRIREIRLEAQVFKLWYITDLEENLYGKGQVSFLHNIIDAVNEGIIASNSEGRIILYNKRVEELEGRTREQVLGKHITEIYDVTPETSEHLTVLETGDPIIDKTLNYFVDGKEMYLTSSSYPVKKDGKVAAVFSIARDITMIRRLMLKTVDYQRKHNEKLPNNGTSFSFADIVGESKAIKETTKEAQKAALSPAPVLIYGETGTGKELFVQGIHNVGKFQEGPFVPVNCAAIPASLLESMLFGTTRGAFTGAQDTKGLLEQAEGGTLYLDEVNSMPVELQAKILRVLQDKTVKRLGSQKERPVDCRIVSSTNVDPWECIEKGTLRKDLFFRLAVIQLTIPPLRERVEDVEVLARFFLEKYARIYGKNRIEMTDDFLKVLKQHYWSGNVRELEHVLENSVAMIEDEYRLDVNKLPYHLISQPGRIEQRVEPGGSTQSLKEILMEVEKETILKSLKLHNWNISRAARHIGIGRQNMQYRMDKLNIKKNNDTSHEKL